MDRFIIIDEERLIIDTERRESIYLGNDSYRKLVCDLLNQHPEQVEQTLKAYHSPPF